MAHRKATRLGAGVLFLVAALVSGSTAGAQTTVTLEQPFTVWSVPSATALDGLGSWMLTGGEAYDPQTQAPPSYAFAHMAFFTGAADAIAVLSLDRDPTGRWIRLFAFDDVGTEEAVELPFNWQPGHFYFPFLYVPSPGVVYALVYDYTAASWTYAGSVNVPPAWGKLSTVSGTGIFWLDEDQPACSSYPMGEVYRLVPTALVGSTWLNGAAVQRAVIPGTCPSATTPAISGVWDRYRTGTFPA